MAKVNVILPVYNCEKYIEESVSSILNQSFKDFELLLLDDGSTDSTIEKLDKFKDIRLKIYRNDVNRGLIYTLNRGLELSSDCKYIARMDADDISLPTRFEMQVNYLNSNLSVGVLGAATNYFGQTFFGRSKYYPKTNEKIVTSLICENPLSHPTVMMRSELFYKIHYNDDFPKYEDYALWISLIDKTKFANLDRVLLKYRRHSHNVTSTYSRDVSKDFLTFCKLIVNLKEKLNINFDNDEINLLAVITSNSRYALQPNINVIDIIEFINTVTDRLNENRLNLTHLKYLLVMKASAYLFYHKRYKDIFMVLSKFNLSLKTLRLINLYVYGR